MVDVDGQVPGDELHQPFLLIPAQHLRHVVAHGVHIEGDQAGPQDAVELHHLHQLVGPAVAVVERRHAHGEVPLQLAFLLHQQHVRRPTDVSALLTTVW